jgi:hypothetical protein
MRINASGELLLGSTTDNGSHKLQLTGNLYGTGYFDQAEIAAPGTPASSFGRWYVGTDNKPRFIDDAGTDYDLTATGGGGYTTEQVQDDVGAMINASLQYVDATPLLAIGDRDYGDFTFTGSGLVAALDANVVSNSKFRQSAGLSVVGRSANSTGDIADITGTDGQVLRVSGTTLGFGTVATAGIADAAVTFAKVQNLAQYEVIGRTASGTGVSSAVPMQVINLTSPLAGDILVYDAANAEFDNARGTAYNVVSTKTTTATLTTSEETIFANASETAFTITLPAASGNAGKRYNIICTGTQGATVTIDGNGSETINNLLTVTMEYALTRWELICDGSGWVAQFYNNTGPDENLIIMNDDFFEGAEIGEVGELGWNIVGVGTETFPQVDGLSGHPGIILMGTSATSGDDCDMFLGGTATSGALNPLLPDNDFDVTSMIRITTITSVDVVFGLSQVALNASYATNHFAGFIFDPAVSAKWRMRTRAGANTDNTSTGADVAAGTWYKLRMIKTGSTIRFYINDVFQFAHTTNLPTNALSPHFSINTQSAAIRTMDVDWFNLRTNVVR